MVRTTAPANPARPLATRLIRVILLWGQRGRLFGLSRLDIGLYFDGRCGNSPTHNPPDAARNQTAHAKRPGRNRRRRVSKNANNGQHNTEHGKRNAHLERAVELLPKVLDVVIAQIYSGQIANLSQPNFGQDKKGASKFTLTDKAIVN